VQSLDASNDMFALSIIKGLRTCFVSDQRNEIAKCFNECTRTYLVSYTGACVAPDIWYPLLEIVKKSAKYLACRHHVSTMFSQYIRSKQALILKRSKQAPQLEKKDILYVSSN
jgi:REP element-mobilizing transposase RayT